MSSCGVVYSGSLYESPKGEVAKYLTSWCQVCTHLLRALYVRDSRLQFCGSAAWPVEGAIPEGGGAALVTHAVHSRPFPTHLRQLNLSQGNITLAGLGDGALQMLHDTLCGFCSSGY